MLVMPVSASLTYSSISSQADLTGLSVTCMTTFILNVEKKKGELEKKRKKSDSSYQTVAFFLAIRGVEQQQSPHVMSVVAVSVCAQQGCNAMSGFMSCTQENAEGRRTSYSAWYNSS